MEMIRVFMQTTLSLLRTCLGWGISFFLFGLILGAHLLLVFCNYQALQPGFEMLNLETQRLGEDFFLGGIFTAIGLEKATLTHLYAAALAVAVAIGFVMLTYYVVEAVKLFLNRHEYARQGQREQYQSALVQTLVRLALVGAPLAYAVNWDVDLFRYRSAALAMSFSNVDTPMTVKDWPLLLRDYGNLFAFQLARVGAWGYIAVTALVCVAMEFSVEHLRARSALVGAALERLIDVPFRTHIPVPVPGAADTPRTQGTQPPALEAAPTPEPARQQASRQPPPEAVPETPTETVAEAPLEPAATDQSPSEASPTPPDVPIPEAPVTETRSAARPQPVIDGNGRATTATVEEALSRPQEYYVDESGRVWAREYYDLVAGNSHTPST